MTVRPDRPSRAAALATAVAILLAPAVARAQDDAVTRANRMAYEASMKCFVANGRAMGLRKRAGDVAMTRYYEDKSRQSFDTAVKLGLSLDRDRDQIEQDFSIVQVRELPEIIRNDGYFRDAIATCKALGLM
jgi:hypothetical protein